ncbi:DUF397 domain-containing protein [Streptosporangium carneum]|uniref:DUF397 domain-containing protein n=1 Tax=Streptosporangium carneum TaxID=47481 RepID=A0A9W6IA53_9ACTN|nr:DUF397 domain-containing protein [Streptosporangium carneum]GLK14910.1 hypothetical protein GCM10017600_83230 [Streptosporangium carneum]
MDLSNLPWRKSSFSSPNGGDCVEVAELGVTSPRPEHKQGARHVVRDSKDPSGPVLYFTPAGWKAFLDSVKASDLGGGPTEQSEHVKRTQWFGHVE